MSLDRFLLFLQKMFYRIPELLETTFLLLKKKIFRFLSGLWKVQIVLGTNVGQNTRCLDIAVYILC